MLAPSARIRVLWRASLTTLSTSRLSLTEFPKLPRTALPSHMGKTILVDDHLPELLRSIQRHNAVNGFSRHHLQQGEYNNRHTEEREERQAYSFQDNSDHTNSPCILRPAARFHWPQARVFCRK